MYGYTGVIDKDTNPTDYLKISTSQQQRVQSGLTPSILKVIHSIEYSKSSFKAIIVITQKLISTSISKAPRT